MGQIDGKRSSTNSKTVGIRNVPTDQKEGINFVKIVFVLRVSSTKNKVSEPKVIRF